jgi:hypothetical protein
LKERISVEMVFRGLDHFSRALHQGESEDVVAFLADIAVAKVVKA